VAGRDKTAGDLTAATNLEGVRLKGPGNINVDELAVAQQEASEAAIAWRPARTDRAISANNALGSQVRVLLGSPLQQKPLAAICVKPSPIQSLVW